MAFIYGSDQKHSPCTFFKARALMKKNSNMNLKPNRCSHHFNEARAMIALAARFLSVASVTAAV